MYEEFLKQAREFGQSVWGGLFQFLGGTLIVVISFFPIRTWRLWHAVMGLIAGVGFTATLFGDGHTLLGSLLALIVGVGGISTIILQVQKRKGKTHREGEY